MRTTNIKGREGLVTCAGVEQSKKFSKKKRGENMNCRTNERKKKTGENRRYGGGPRRCSGQSIEKYTT